MKKILIADDNEDITDILSAYIEKEGYEPIVARDGQEALTKFEKYRPVLVLLDIMMPKIDGYEVCRSIRHKSNVPIILVTARGEDFERVMGLDIGADDYIVKPFSPNEVMARVRAVLRRTPKNNHTIVKNDKMLSIDNLTVNLEEYTASINGEKVSLTKKEIETMWILGQHPNKVYTRDNLLDSLWGYDYFGDSRTVDSHIKRLRAKIDKFEHPGWSIKTIWGVGYKFEINEENV
ncbi:MAG: response regulator transcription factor [Lachnospiraceae bacterium]|nr:response regulator transcription factor [Lachnospiraceae bacterium]